MSRKIVFLTLVTLLIYFLTSVRSLQVLDKPPWSWNPDDKGPDGLPTGRPLILGHRGSCGMYPEHTVISYTEGAKDGADLIECDMVLTKDLQIVCSHESWISKVSNVNNSQAGPPHADFSNRLATYDMDDDEPHDNWHDWGNITDFFSIDFTLDELLTLRRRQANDFRDPLYNWNYTFVTLEEYIGIAKAHKVGIYPELKELSATNRILDSRNISARFEDLALAVLAKHNYTGPDDPCFLQCFELSSLEKLKDKTKLRRILLLDLPEKAVPSTFERAQKSGIFGIGISKSLLVEVQNSTDEKPGHIKRVNFELINQIKSHGLALHGFTFRNEPQFLNWDDGQDYIAEYERFVDLGVEAFFTDFPKSMRRYFDSRMKNDSSDSSQFQALSPLIYILVALTTGFVVVFKLQI